MSEIKTTVLKLVPKDSSITRADIEVFKQEAERLARLLDALPRPSLCYVYPYHRPEIPEELMEQCTQFTYRYGHYVSDVITCIGDDTIPHFENDLWLTLRNRFDYFGHGNYLVRLEVGHFYAKEFHPVLGTLSLRKHNPDRGWGKYFVPVFGISNHYLTLMVRHTVTKKKYELGKEVTLTLRRGRFRCEAETLTFKVPDNFHELMAMMK